jgi:hypothetical protein
VVEPGGCGAGDLPLGLVLVVGLHQLPVLLLDLLGVLAGWPEQQRLEMAEQVLAACWVTCPSATPACRSPTNPKIAGLQIRRSRSPEGQPLVSAKPRAILKRSGEHACQRISMRTGNARYSADERVPCRPTGGTPG